MKIYVVSAVGQASTLMSAFDNALYNAGVQNYNLIKLSSIIPPQSKVIRVHRYKTPEDEFGYKLYIVKAEIRSEEVGKYLGSGIGWIQFSDGRGFFMEYETKGENKAEVESEIGYKIKNSLRDFCHIRKKSYSEKRTKMSIAITRIENKPSCSLSLAIFQSKSWDNVISS